MRPIDRGPCPQKNGADIVFTAYGDALEHLTERLGHYCSYCEMPIKNAPEVEHVAPKSLYPDKIVSWDNFLLACKSCNTIKGSKPNDDLSLYYFPDEDDVLEAFRYDEDGRVRVNETLDELAQERAKRTMELVGLDRYPRTLRRPTKKDRRWHFRKEAVITARRAAQLAAALAHRPESLELIAMLAADTGFWSVFMTVFRDEPEVKRCITSGFPNTRAY